MSLDRISVALAIVYSLEQFFIGWYGWRNPRVKFNIVRKILSGLFLLWALFSAYKIVVPDMAPTNQMVAQYGMTMFVLMNGATVLILGLAVWVVRKKYFQRVGEVSG